MVNRSFTFFNHINNYFFYRNSENKYWDIELIHYYIIYYDVKECFVYRYNTIYILCFIQKSTIAIVEFEIE